MLPSRPSGIYLAGEDHKIWRDLHFTEWLNRTAKAQTESKATTLLQQCYFLRSSVILTLILRRLWTTRHS